MDRATAERTPSCDCGGCQSEPVTVAGADLTRAVPKLLTIGEVARAADVSTSSLRFYEAEGLVVPAERSSTGYRLYDDEQVDRVRFIRRAQRLGLSLAEVGELLTAADSHDSLPARDRLRHLVAHKIVTIRQQIDELEAFTGQLESVHQRLDDGAEWSCRDLTACGCLTLDQPIGEGSVISPAVGAASGSPAAPTPER